MNRREMFKAIIGTAVAAAVPSMPFVWREASFSEIVANTLRARHADVAASVMKNNAIIALMRQKLANVRADIIDMSEGRPISR